jgi:hypothetical protein
METVETAVASLPSNQLVARGDPCRYRRRSRWEPRRMSDSTVSFGVWYLTISVGARRSWWHPRIAEWSVTGTTGLSEYR